MFPVGNDNRLGPPGFCGVGPNIVPGPYVVGPRCNFPDLFKDDTFVGVPAVNPANATKMSAGLESVVGGPILSSYHECTNRGDCQELWDRHQKGMNEITAAVGAEIGSRIGGHAGPVGAFAGGIIGGLVGGALELFH